MSLSFLLRRPDLVVVDKPAGTPVIPGRGEARVTPLVAQLEAALGRKVWVVHRLDRDTSGALVFALDAPTHRALSMAFERGEHVSKQYLALCQGRLERGLEIDVPLVPARRGRMRPARPNEPGKPARTRITPMAHFGDRATLVRAEPLTGRTHQIRVHLRAAGHPLLFDHQYGRTAPLTASDLGGQGGEIVLVRTPLHAERLAICGLADVPDVDVTAPVPPDMARALELLRAA